MDTFRDQLLVCEECGGQFVFTVGEQRRMLDSQGRIENPAHCPVCGVKRDRDADRQATASNETPHVEELPAWLAPATGSVTSESDSNDPGVSSATDHAGDTHPLHGQNGARRRGTVKWFNNRKGFGFITLDDGNELFVHYSGILGDGYRSLTPDQEVTLVVEETDKGPQASEVEVIED